MSDLQTILDRIDVVQLNLSKAQGVNALLGASHGAEGVTEADVACATAIVGEAIEEANLLISELWGHLKAMSGPEQRRAA